MQSLVITTSSSSNAEKVNSKQSSRCVWTSSCCVVCPICTDHPKTHPPNNTQQDAQSQLDKERHKLKDILAAKEALAKERARLQQETRELTDDRHRLAESEAQLRQQEAMLQAANDRLVKDKDTLAKQLEELQIKQEAALQRLRAQVGNVIERFAAGRINSQGLLTQLRDLGVELTDEADVPQLTATMHDEYSGYVSLYFVLKRVLSSHSALPTYAQGYKAHIAY